MGDNVAHCSQDIVDYRLNNPCLTLQAIGNKFGLSRERVRQLLARANVKTSNYLWDKKTRCIICGKRSSGCHQFRMCRECYTKQHYITLICAMCNKPFEVQQWTILHPDEKRHRKFCSRQCFNKYRVLKSHLTNQ
jgi:hypothetical protein